MMRTLLLCITFLALLAIPSSAEVYNHLLAGERLNTGEFIFQSGYQFIIQDDCNLVLYDFTTPVWASGTDNKGSGCFVTMQTDGNLVVYDASNTAIWASDTNGENGNYILIAQKDGNVVIYSKPIWATGTNKFGMTGVVIASARNGTVLPSGAQQNKVRKMLKILEVTE